MKVEQRMNKNVVTLTGDRSLRDAITFMRKHRIRHIPVVEAGRVVGILTDRDIKRASPSLLSGISQDLFDKVLDETKVSQVMTRNPFTVTPSTSLKDVAKVLADHKYGAVPVVEGGKLVGIITETDMMRALYDMMND